MVLASGFRGSMLRLPLSGMVYCEIATRTLDLRACNPRRGRREDRAVKKCQSLMSRPQNLAFPRRQDSQLLTFVKRNDHLMTARSQDRLPTGIRLFSRPRIRDGPEKDRSDMVLFHFSLHAEIASQWNSDRDRISFNVRP